MWPTDCKPVIRRVENATRPRRTSAREETHSLARAPPPRSQQWVFQNTLNCSSSQEASGEMEASEDSEAGKPEINTTLCFLAGGRARTSAPLVEVGETEGERGERGGGGAGTALRRVAEHWVSMQLARASTPAFVCVCACKNTTKPHTDRRNLQSQTLSIHTTSVTLKIKSYKFN